MELERRSDKRKGRTERVVVGASIGVPAATVIAWYLDLNGIKMPPGVEAGMGALIGAVIVCLHSELSNLTRLLGQIIRKWAGLKP